MALQSPGVQVTVIDESFYTPAEPGTTPLIVVATAQNKSNAAATGTAAGTLQANSGRAFRITSQRDLVDTFGIPFFEKSTGNNPVHGGERNEYGLLAAYSLLGVTNSVFIVRANVDLDQLAPQATEPGTDPADGQWWIDTSTTAWGIKEWNAAATTTVGGQKFANKTPIVLTNDDSIRITNNAPSPSVGSIGDYAVVIQSPTADDNPADDSNSYARFYYKSSGGVGGITSGQWVLVGSNEWSLSFPTVLGANTVNGSTLTGTFTINNNLITVTGVNMSGLVGTINSAVNSVGVYAANVQNKLYLYTNGTSSSDGLPGDSSLDGNIRIEAGNGSILDDLGIIAKLYYGPALQQTSHTQVPAWKTNDSAPRPSGSVWVNTTQPNNGSRWRVRRWNSLLRVFEPVEAPIYATSNDALAALDRTQGGLGLPVNTLFVQSNAEEHTGFDQDPSTATFRVWRRSISGATTIKSTVIAGLGTGLKTFEIAESIRGQAGLTSAKSVSFTAAGTSSDAESLATAIGAAGFENIQATVTANNEIEISHKLGGDFRIDDVDGIFGLLFSPYNVTTKLGTRNFYTAPAGSDFDFLASNWQPLAAVNFVAKASAPQSDPANDQLWYNPEVSEIDIMIHDGNTWKGYRNVDLGNGTGATDPNGPQVRATAPTKQSDGLTDLVNGDLWISTADQENFPTIYRWSADFLEWQLVDKTDQDTEDGILFADARAGLNGGSPTSKPTGTISQLLLNNFLDPDAPDPALYPKGMMLWNLRRSGGNVKRYVKNYIDLTADNIRFNDQAMGGGPGGNPPAYYADRWVTASANNEDGSGSFLRKAQRKVVVSSLKSTVDTSSEIRDEERRNFNIIACPGYPEVFSNMINLNIDRGETAFVIADSPFRLPSDATSIIRWASNEQTVFDNGDDGLVSFDPFSAVFYPSGFTTDLSGTNAVVPSSHMMLRTMVLSDQVSYPWFAPAGTRRGGITNATAVGYIDPQTGEFQTVALNEGQRDVLYEQKVNPITFFNGVGLVNFGQKTRSRGDSALDRINVARLVVYLRSQLQRLARPYIFEPNDKLTRDEVRQACESLLLELVGLRAIFDFAVVCDESNNTPTRVDRNELWVDIAIEPVKAVEFIYIPLRVKNTGEI
jgi:hypothetical protein